MTRRKTDGECIAARLFGNEVRDMEPKWLAMQIDRLVRKRMAEAWDLGRTYGLNDIAADANPYRKRRKAKP